LNYILFFNFRSRVRYWIIHNDLISKVFLVLQDNSKILNLQFIKFIKSVFLNNDENLNKLVINNDVFEQIIKIFNENKKKDNLLLSSVLDLFEHVKKQNMKKIIAYLFEKHYDFFYDESNKNFFKGLISKYEGGLDHFSSYRVNSESEEKM
jgi:protein phosphatase-4 regulatory subunit 3